MAFNCDADKAVPWVEKKTGKTLAASQRAALQMALGAKVENARLGLVSCFGMVNYDRGLCCGAAILTAGPG